jgi:hypothetical protein
MYPDDRSRQWRARVSAVALSLIVGSGIFFFLVIVTGGLFLSVLAAGAAMLLVGTLHYALWGRELAREVRRKNDYIPPRRP